MFRKIICIMVALLMVMPVIPSALVGADTVLEYGLRDEFLLENDGSPGEGAEDLGRDEGSGAGQEPGEGGEEGSGGEQDEGQEANNDGQKIDDDATPSGDTGMGDGQGSKDDENKFGLTSSENGSNGSLLKVMEMDMLIGMVLK